MGANLILGSKSPRRAEILSAFSIPFKVVDSHFDESTIKFLNCPKTYVADIARAKAEAISQLYSSATILTADTIVFFNNKVYLKPSSKEMLYQYLDELKGNWHQVFTSLSLISAGKQYREVEMSEVLMNNLTKTEAELYCKQIPWQDKAGGYMAQLPGSVIIKEIKGCFYNVMGLPINSLAKILSHIDIDLWQHLKSQTSA